MGYYFECPSCNHVTPCDTTSLTDRQFERTCYICGDDICVDCAQECLCQDCWDSELDNEDEDA